MCFTLAGGINMDTLKQDNSANIFHLSYPESGSLSVRTSLHFLKSVVDALPDNIVVIDGAGTIQFANRGWEQFGDNNGADNVYTWTEYNYIRVCEAAAAAGDAFGQKALKGIRLVISGKKNSFCIEYPCHGKRKKRWFSMTIKPFKINDVEFFLISHQDITKRKLIEEKILDLSRIDSLTNIANRRSFDEFLEFQWKHCKRYEQPISIALIDIDHFKMLNDHYGHQSGDDCLKQIGKALSKVTQRPDDLCARYGGEEFAIIFGETTAEQSLTVITKLLKDIKKLKIPNKESPVFPYVTVSVGISNMVPTNTLQPRDLIYESDQQLYKAKANGKNQISVKSDTTNKH